MGEPVSSKSSKLNGSKFKISSYRLTTCETIEEFKNEITKRDESFTRYLVCLTQELKNKHIVKWGFISKDKADTSTIEWEFTYNKEGKKTGLISKDRRFKISRKMSNQLWINFNLTDLDVFCTFEYELNK
jgi:hypothetical protein